MNGYNLIQTRGIYNRRRDGEQAKTVAVKAPANLAAFTAITGLLMLCIFISVLAVFEFFKFCAKYSNKFYLCK